MASFERTATDTQDWDRRKNPVSQWNRRRKWSLFQREFSPSADWKVLDVGYSDEEFQETDNFIEKHYPYPEQLTALGVDEPKRFPERYPTVRVVHYDGVTFPFEDDEFDLVWSNAVIEHVGPRDRQLNFLREIRRVGKRAIVTTPNRHFPVEVHTRTPFLHFLPEPVFHAYLKLIGKDWAAKDYMWLLSKSDLKGLLAEAGITRYRLVQNKFAGFTLDFVVLIDGE